MANADELFAGEPLPLGGLSNEEELSMLCPEEFKKPNPWSEYAMKFFFEGGKIGNWKWKSDDKKVRVHQLNCFHGFLATFEIPHKDKESVAGWMLSEMLEEVPEMLEEVPEHKEIN